MVMLVYLCCGCDILDYVCCWFFFFFFKQKTAYEMRISDWSSDVCSSDLTESRDLGTLCKGRTGSDGVLECSISLQEAGSIELIATAQDQQGRTSEIGRASCRERVCQYV